MLSQENGVLPGSDYYFMTPTALAEEIFFYPYMCGHFRCISGYEVKRDNYHNYLLMYVVKGHCEVEFEGEIHRASEHDLILLDCHKPHRYTAKDYLEIIWLHYDGHDADTLYREIFKTVGLICPLDEQSEIVATLKEILLLYRNHQKMSEAEFSWKIYRLLCLLLATPAAAITPSQQDSINAALDFIDAHLTDEIKLADIAAHINLSVYHFSRLFKMKVGHSPYHYILTARIDRAKTLLKSTSVSVKEIARQVGFNSETNFISTFSNRVGIPPQRFREFPL